MKLHFWTALLVGVLVMASAPGVRGARTEKPIEVNLIELTSIDYEIGDSLPDEILELDDKVVVIEGFMKLGTQEGEQKFQLITDACNCSGKVKVHHFVEVDLGDDVTEYTPELIKVTGKFSVSIKWENGFATSLYRLKAETLE